MRGENRPRTGLAEGTVTLAGCPHLAQIRRVLFIAQRPGGGASGNHPGSPHLRELTQLDLGSNRFGPRARAGGGLAGGGVAADPVVLLRRHWAGRHDRPGRVAAPEPAPDLQLHGCHIGTAGVRALVQSRTLTQLKDLALGFNRIDTKGIHLLAQCPHLAGLERLGIAYNGPAIMAPVTPAPPSWRDLLPAAAARWTSARARSGRRAFVLS